MSARRSKTDLYVNENLTPLRSTILYVLRMAKRKFPSIITGCGSNDGSVYAFLKPLNSLAPDARDVRLKINNQSELKRFFADRLDSTVESLIAVWPH